MKVRIHIVIWGLLLWTSAQLPAQQVGNGQWINGKVSQDYKKFTWSIEPNIRFRNGFNVIDNLFLEAGVKRKINKNFDIAGKYRVGYNGFQSSSHSIYHRFNMDLTWDKKWKRADIKITYRPRAQVKFQREEGGIAQDWYFRNKLSFSKNITKKWDANLGTELFTKLNDREQGILNNEIRLYGGVEWEFKKRQKIEIYYLLSQEFNRKNPMQAHNLGLGYSYELKKLKLGKKQEKGR